LDKKAVSSSGFSCSVCTLCRPLRCKALKSRLWQKDAPCQRLYLYSDLLLGCAFTVCRGNDRPAAIRSAQAHLLCAAVNEIRLCSPDELTVLEVLAALVHSQQLCASQPLFLGEGTRQDYGMIRFDAEPFDVAESYMRLMLEN